MGLDLVFNIFFSVFGAKMNKEKQRKEFERAERELFLQKKQTVQNELQRNRNKLISLAGFDFNKQRFTYVYLFFRINFFRNIFLLLGLFLISRLLINKK
ncbi:hypothetical protein CAPN001_08540 [Capnocytophaga stomatis]|nr:hypothetical protein CAPN001_08540 [Capnocytophaga stomatis]